MGIITQEQLVKTIAIEQKFADTIFKDYRSERYGITHCCPNDISKFQIKKNICDWENAKLDVLVTETTISTNVDPIEVCLVTVGSYIGGISSNTDLSDLGDKHYTHNQVSASSIWIINHDLEKYPSTTVVDSGGNVVIGDVQHISLNRLTITFNASFSGKAYLN